MSGIKYRFVTPSDSSKQGQGQGDSDDFTFYHQICTFPNPYNNKYHMRKFVINGNNEFEDVKDFYLSKKQCKKFYKIKKPNEFKCYHVYSLDDIDYPNMSDVLTSKSQILGTNYDYSGFAPF